MTILAQKLHAWYYATKVRGVGFCLVTMHPTNSQVVASFFHRPTNQPCSSALHKTAAEGANQQGDGPVTLRRNAIWGAFEQ